VGELPIDRDELTRAELPARGESRRIRPDPQSQLCTRIDQGEFIERLSLASLLEGDAFDLCVNDGERAPLLQDECFDGGKGMRIHRESRVQAKKE
jgi:hypothetical protein